MKKVATILFLALAPFTAFAGGSLDLEAEVENEALRLQLELQILQLQLQIAQILAERGEGVVIVDDEVVVSDDDGDSQVIVIENEEASEPEESVNLSERGEIVTFSIRASSVPQNIQAGDTVAMEWVARGFGFSDLITIEAYAGDNQHFFGSFIPSNEQADLVIPAEFAGEEQITFIVKYNGSVIDSEARTMSI